MVLHNLCIDRNAADLAPPEPEGGAADVRRTSEGTVMGGIHHARVAAYNHDVCAAYGVVLGNESNPTWDVPKSWSKEKLDRRMNTKSKMRDALAHAVEEANFVRPSRSSWTQR